MALTAGFQLPFGIQPLNPVPTDAWSGPYEGATESVAKSAANAAIPSGVRFKSMEVRLIINGISSKYWYRDGITNSDLIEFSSSSSYLPLSGGIITDKLTVAATVTSSRLNIGNALSIFAPASTVDGDVWITNQSKLAWKASGQLVVASSVGQINTFTQPQVIQASNNTSAALRITQTGLSNAILVEDDTNPDNTPFIVDNLGSVGVGLTSVSGIDAKLTVIGNVSATGSYYGDGSKLTGIVAGDTIATTLVRSNSANWNSVYSNVVSNSAIWEAGGSGAGLSNYLPLSGGTITGSISADGKLVIGHTTSSPDPDSRIVVIDENNNGWKYYQFNDADGTNYRNYRARGTVTSPSAVLNNDRLASFLGAGKTNNGWSAPVGGISIRAAENFTDTNCGTYVVIGTSLTGTNMSGGGTERMRITHDGKVGIGTTTPNEALTVTGNVSATGSITANTLQASVKNFVIKHPTDDSKSLQYSSLETPYIGVRLTGEDKVINGECVVDLPDYIKGLIHEEDVHILLTNYKHSNIIYIDEIDIENNRFTVKSDNCIEGKEYKFFWSLTGVRKDVPKLQVEI